MSDQPIREIVSLYHTGFQVGEAIHVKQDGVDYGWFKVAKVSPEKIDLQPLPGKPS